MSKEGYSPEKKDGDNKVVLERLQTYLKDKRSSEVEPGLSYPKPGTSFESEPHTATASTLEDNSTVLREVLNHKKAEFLRQPEIVEYIKSLSSDLKK